MSETVFSIKKIGKNKIIEVQRSHPAGQYLRSTTEKKHMPGSMRLGVEFCSRTRLIALFLVPEEKILAERHFRSLWP